LEAVITGQPIRNAVDSQQSQTFVSSKTSPRNLRLRNSKMIYQGFDSALPSRKESDHKKREDATKTASRQSGREQNKDAAEKLKDYREFELRAQQTPTASRFSNTRAEKMDHKQ
jgi:hypothetical protein